MLPRMNLSSFPWPKIKDLLVIDGESINIADEEIINNFNDSKNEADEFLKDLEIFMDELEKSKELEKDKQVYKKIHYMIKT